METIDLRQFCDEEKHPIWKWNGHIYATTGWCLVRVPDAGSGYPQAKDDPRMASSAEELLGDGSGQYYQAPDVCMDGSRCGMCGGRGMIHVADCPECGSVGSLMIESSHNEYDVKCKTCDGYGYARYNADDDGWDVTCRHCDGVGLYFLENPRVEWRGVLLQRVFFAMTHDLTGLELASPALSQYGIIRFRFRGGVGAVMPCMR